MVDDCVVSCAVVVVCVVVVDCVVVDCVVVAVDIVVVLHGLSYLGVVGSCDGVVIGGPV
jgi:hypothetical protein